MQQHAQNGARYTTAQLARLAHMARRTILDWEHRGVLPEKGEDGCYPASALEALRDIRSRYSGRFTTRMYTAWRKAQEPQPQAPAAPAEPPWLSVAELARQSGVNESSIYRYVASHQLPARHAGRRILCSPSAVSLVRQLVRKNASEGAKRAAATRQARRAAAQGNNGHEPASTQVTVVPALVAPSQSLFDALPEAEPVNAQDRLLAQLAGQVSGLAVDVQCLTDKLDAFIAQLASSGKPVRAWLASMSDAIGVPLPDASKEPSR